MFSATEHFEFASCLLQLLPQGVALARQLVTFDDKRFRHDDVARATAANARGRGIFFGAIWTDRAQGRTFRTKMVVPARPSLSLMSTLTMCSPAGSSASGMSMPVGCTKDLMRGVRSTFGVLR